MISLAFYYVRWHYSQALVDLLRIIGNFLWFFYEFFSIPLLLRTFFVPFHRLEDDRKKSFALDFEAMGEALIVSTLMRIVGMIVRTALILSGIIFLLVTLVFGTTIFLVWLCAPLFLLFIIMTGLTMVAVA